MKLLLITTVALGVLQANTLHAQSADTSAVISSATDNYQFVYNTGSRSVSVKEQQAVTYLASNFQTNIPIAELYNDEVSVDKVQCKVDGHTPRDFKPLTSYFGGEDVFFSDEHICYFSLNIPKKGSSAVVTFNKTVNDPRYFTGIDFSEPYAVAEKIVTISVPRWMKVELKEYNFEGFDIHKTTQYSSADDADQIIYTIKKLPATVKESNSPGPTYLYPHLLVMCKSAQPQGEHFTYLNTLDDQYKWYHSLITTPAGNQPTIEAKAKELTAGLSNDIAKIKAIFYYVQDNIRYIAFEDGLAGLRPESAEEVLRKKYGDCKGMANLTKSLLKAAGFDAHLCWLGTNHIAYDYQTPSLAVDNHMICALNYQGKTYFLDATETYLGFNEYAERIQGRQVLMDNGDKYQLSRIPASLPGQNADIETGKFSISADGFSGTVNHIWKGEDKEDFLTGLNSVKKEKAETAVVNFISAGNTAYVISNLKLTNLSNPDEDAAASYSVNFKDGFSTFGKEYYIDLDRNKELRDAAIKVSERHNDYWFNHKMNLTVEHELTLPAGYKTDQLPAALNIVNPDYEFHIQYTALPGKLLYKKNLIIKNPRLPKTRFAQWNTDIEQLTKTYNESVVLKPITE